jgi:glycosyltransferase involved in cell wall biosynthesis
LSAISIKEALASSKNSSRLSENIAAGAKRELRVLQVFSGLGMGGAETWLMSLLKYFHEHNADSPVRVKFDVLLTGGEKAVFDDEAVALGARLFYLRFGRRNLVSFAREFRKILATGNYDAIHDHQDYIAGLHFLIGAGHLPPTRIAHVHNPLYHRISYADGPTRCLAQSAGKRLLSKLATHVMGTSKQILEEYGFAGRGFRDVKTGAAHCGFDVSRFQGDRTMAHQLLCRELSWDESAKVLLFVGRLDGAEIEYQGELMNHKNPQFALAVARVCIARDPTVRLAMVGAGGAKRREFEQQVKEWGLGQEVCFLGARNDVSRLMLGANLLLFPSLAEGLGMVAVEAQAAGLPVLASDSTPRECVVIPGMVEFLQLGDSKAWVNEALRLLNTDVPDIKRCNAAVAASAYAIEHSTSLLVDLYRS